MRPDGVRPGLRSGRARRTAGRAGRLRTGRVDRGGGRWRGRGPGDRTGRRRPAVRDRPGDPRPRP
ncbi:hypothetical protein ACFFX0_08745 [Citricoccus parietis]|uniref:Uncharacterized protein n=1 Tax=Citricoccus parietis TaxID=592307 RepID=A0ABV5FX81_9MICC